MWEVVAWGIFDSEPVGETMGQQIFSCLLAGAHITIDILKMLVQLQRIDDGRWKDKLVSLLEFQGSMCLAKSLGRENGCVAISAFNQIPNHLVLRLKQSACSLPGTLHA